MPKIMAFVFGVIKDPTKEEINFLRFCWILNSIATSFVKRIFDFEFHPDELQATFRHQHKKINDLKNKRIINQSLYRLLNSKDVSSTKFDITMMICLLRHLADFPIEDILPSVHDESVAAALSRLKFYRNLISHGANGKISDADFDVYFDDIRQSLARIDKTRAHELDEYKTCKLDGISKEAADNVNINLKIQNWMAREETLVETNAMVLVEENILQNKFLIIKGHSGTGKSAMLQHVAIQLQNEKQFQIIPVDTPSQIKEFHNPDSKQLFVLDDFFGRYCINSGIVSQWQTLSKDIIELLNENTKILMAGNSNIINNIDIGILRSDDTEIKVFDLNSEGTCPLNYEQRKEIADNYLGQDDYDNGILSTQTEYFPLLCQMYATHKTGNITHFFKENICDLIWSDKSTCAVLCLFVLSNNKVSEAITNTDILQKLSDELKIKPGLTWAKIQIQLENMCKSYVTKAASLYKINNDKIFNLLLAYYGQDKFLLFMLKHSCSKTIRYRFRLQSMCERVEDCSIEVNPDNEVWYFKRLLRDIIEGNAIDVFKNIQLSSADFRGTLITKITKCVNSCDVINAILSFSQKKESPLLIAAQKGYLNLVEFFIKIKMNINVENGEHENPVYLASAGGYLDIVKLLLNNNCDCNSNQRNLPLHIAIRKNHINIVAELLRNNANPNGRNHLEIDLDKSIQLYKDESSLSLAKRADTDRTSLFVASLKGRKECVELLLKYGADPNECAYYNVSPLYAAAEEGHLGIVKILLKHNANIDAEADNKKTPLHAASEKGHAHVVKCLLKAGASIDATDDYGTTPLLAATQNEKENVVRLLLENEANPNKLNKSGNYALKESVSNFEILKLLLDNNADSNLMNDKKECALLSACERGVVDAVTLLLERNADPNIKTLDQRSPLFAAVERKHTEIVRALLMYNANTNDRNQSHQSVIAVSSQKGEAYIVKMLKNAQKGIKPTYIKPIRSIQSSPCSSKTPVLPIKTNVKKQKREAETIRPVKKVTKIHEKDQDATSTLKHRGGEIKQTQTLCQRNANKAQVKSIKKTCSFKIKENAEIEGKNILST